MKDFRSLLSLFLLRAAMWCIKLWSAAQSVPPLLLHFFHGFYILLSLLHTSPLLTLEMQNVVWIRFGHHLMYSSHEAWQQNDSGTFYFFVRFVVVSRTEKDIHYIGPVASDQKWHDVIPKWGVAGSRWNFTRGDIEWGKEDSVFVLCRCHAAAALLHFHISLHKMRDNVQQYQWPSSLELFFLLGRGSCVRHKTLVCRLDGSNGSLRARSRRAAADTHKCGNKIKLPRNTIAFKIAGQGIQTLQTVISMDAFTIHYQNMFASHST